MKPSLPSPSDSTQPVRRTGLHFPLCLGALALGVLVGLPFLAVSQTDDFDDGDDAGWTRYDRTGMATFTFPDGGYRLQAQSVGPVETDKALVLATRGEDYTNFYAAVDLVNWDDNTVTNARSAIGLAFRAADVGLGTTRSLVAYWTPAISGGGNRVFSIYYLWSDFPISAVAATLVTLEPTNTYRMVATGVGDFIEAKLYDLKDLTTPVAYISGHLTGLGLEGFDLPQSGKCGLFLYSRNNTTVTATYDNYVAAELDPGLVPPPATPHPIPGTPQVVNRVPVSNKNFHPRTAEISFNATTLGGNGIDPSGVRLTLNGVDVSSRLSISGSTNNRTVSYSGLASNKLYHANITLTETGGKSSTNDFYFDTFSESYITNVAKLVEVEDYNYSNGQYQNDPPPSGYDSTQNLVNGGGVGYVDLVGTPDVDYFDRRSGPEVGYSAYRSSDSVGTFAGSLYYLTDGGGVTVATNDTPLQKFASLGLPDYQVQHTEGGEWLNYTRTFAPDRYKVFLRLSGISPQDVLFDEVTSDRTVTNQTTVNLGKFAVINTGHISTYRYFPLVDDMGNPVVLNWSGEKTFRLTMGGPQQDLTKNTLQMNYLMFMPAPAAPTPFTLINPGRVGNTFSVSFASESGVTYTLQYKNALTDSWTDGSSVGGDGTIKTLTDVSTESARFYRVSAR